tara:strand:+ start:1302 stop:1841 length:540 start_codon:yes stop_codon:yes gene_type:complete
MIDKALMSSDRADWCTPPEILEYVYKFFPGGVDLDPCSNSAALVDASVAMEGPPGKDGLTEPWSGNVFVNPPYGRNTMLAWARKMAAESAHCEILGLVPARTDTRWCNVAMKSCTLICFVFGRIKFLDQSGAVQYPAPFPSAVFYWGKRPDHFRAVFCDLGSIWGPYESTQENHNVGEQ